METETTYHLWSMQRKGLTARRHGIFETFDGAIQCMPLGHCYVYIQRWEDGECKIYWDSIGLFNPLSPEVIRNLIRRPRKSTAPLPPPTYIENWRQQASF